MFQALYISLLSLLSLLSLARAGEDAVPLPESDEDDTARLQDARAEAEQAEDTTPPLPVPQGGGPQRSLYVMDVGSAKVSTGATITEWMVFDDGKKVRVGEFMRLVGDQSGLRKRRFVAGVNLVGTGLSTIGGVAMLRASQEEGRNEGALVAGGVTLLTTAVFWGGDTFVVHTSYLSWFSRGRAERLCEAYNAGIFEAEGR